MTPKNAADFTEDELRRIEARWKSDVDLKLDRIDRRVGVIERLVWIAVGGVVVLSSATAFGITVVVKQGDKLDSVALRQAAAIATREANDKHQQEQIDRMRASQGNGR